MRYLTFTEIWKLHDLTISRTGGSYGLLYRSALESSIDRSQADRYPTLVDKAAALWWYIGLNEPFVDGNKITAYAAAEVFLLLNGWKINASVDERKRMVLELEAENLNREELVKWLECHVQSQGA
jgi:death on curing protein